MTLPYTRILLCAGVLALAACSQDAPAGDPGGMGASDLSPPPDQEAGTAPAAEILEQAGTPEFVDSTDAGGAGMTSELRDSLDRVR